jgi:hypothetical protein
VTAPLSHPNILADRRLTHYPRIDYVGDKLVQGPRPLQRHSIMGAIRLDALAFDYTASKAVRYPDLYRSAVRWARDQRSGDAAMIRACSPASLQARPCDLVGTAPRSCQHDERPSGDQTGLGVAKPKLRLLG